MNAFIRSMEEKDISAVQHVAKTSWGSTYRGIIPEAIQQKFLSNAYSEGMMQRRMERSLIYVAERNGEVIGFANFSSVKENGEVELSAIYLIPEVQGEGIGTALLEKGLNELENATKLFINVEEKNQLGMRFYKAKGFQTHGAFEEELDDYILKTIRMVKEID
ncbi:GNAT family N-acetyltransferase [Oceanobacillus kapialis]|uniref:GNAT family N-acetyltransferase n=1 Tax=Oceanobacillus kapialis TaxID=481353 RepID=A0ABW5Q3G7_9BACI